jgi:hypothetical protein
VIATLLLTLSPTAPVPKHLFPPSPPATAPSPRRVAVWVDGDGNRHHYVRDYWDGGVLRTRIHEGDPEFNVPVRVTELPDDLPILPPPFAPKI